MGCGKSFVLALFREAGWTTVDCDEIARRLLSSDASVIANVRSLFGDAYVASGGVDRKALAALVFADIAALTQLENVLQPRIRAEWERVLADSAGGPAIVEIPLLFEKNLEKLFDISVCVSAGAKTQLQRLARRGVTRSDALARMARQLPLAQKELRAGFVISNNGNQDFTRAQVARFIRQAH